MNFEVYGNGEEVIFLHGWGQSLETFYPIKKYFSNNKIYLVDLPGFGKSRNPEEYNLDYYVAILRKFIIENKINNPIILGHSFGGRIAIKYSSIYNVKKLILVNSAGIIHHGFKYKVKVFLYKFLKKIGIKINMGSSDYKNCNDELKKVLVSVTNESLIDAMKKIEAQTLLIYGSNDQITPVADAKLIEEYIRNSALVIIPNAAHFSYLDNPIYFALVLESFLMSDIK